MRRKVDKQESIQRGCVYCLNRKGYTCPFSICPYDILDSFDSYEDFVESKDCLKQFLPLFVKDPVRR